MSDERKTVSDVPPLIATVKVPTDPEETWAMGNNYGVKSAVYMGANLYEGNIVTLFMRGKRNGQSETLRMQPEALDQFCKEWLEYRKNEDRETPKNQSHRR